MCVESDMYRREPIWGILGILKQTEPASGGQGWSIISLTGYLEKESRTCRMYRSLFYNFGKSASQIQTLKRDPEHKIPSARPKDYAHLHERGRHTAIGPLSFLSYRCVLTAPAVVFGPG